MKSMTLLCILTVVGISLTATPVQAKKPAAEVQQATKHQQQPPLLMDRAQIHALNTAISQKMGGPITDETAPMTAEKLKSELSRYQMKRALYHDGRLMTEKEKKELRGGADGHVLAISEYEPGADFTYYWGAAWSKADIKDSAAWNAYMADFAQKVRNPLTVTVK